MTGRSLLPLVISALFALSACPSDECQSASDCPSGQLCEAGTCAAPPAGCDPACSGSKAVCDEEARECITCDATEGCASGRVCDLSVAGGACVECLESAGCTGGLPVCDGATHTCVTCTATEGCAAGEACDTTVYGGFCQPVAQRCSSNAQCAAPTPICDRFSGTCKACTAAEGCPPGQLCDISTVLGACVDCLMNEHCAAPMPICNSATRACAVCTATEGCAGGEVCDASVSGGACVGCRTSADCSGASPVCDTAAKSCVVCTALEGCLEAEICDLAVAGGACVTAACSGDGECDTGEVCRGGRCVATCASDPECSGGEVCEGGVCAAPCAGDEQCAGSLICQAGHCVPGCDQDTSCPQGWVCEAGRCVAGCTGDGQCGAGLVCREGHCVSPDCTSSAQCLAPTPVCDLPSGDCVVCTATAGCAGAAPLCDLTVSGGECVECLSAGDCSDASRPLCRSGACVADPAAISAQIGLVRAAGDGGGLSLPIAGALVTYLKPVTGVEEAGFFIQAEQAGPAVFVRVDPATLTPSPSKGDAVGFTVTTVDTLAGVKQVAGIANFTVLSQANPITPLVQQLSSATDLVGALGTYESELVGFSATATADFGYAGSGHVAAPIATLGVPADPDLRLRVPDAVRDGLDLTAGCSFTLGAGPMWRYYDVAQPSAYSTSDLTAVSCPAPRVVGAAALGANQVELEFDRQIATGSVLANGSQFSFDQGLAATGVAGVTGNTVLVSTGAQLPGRTYTATVAASVQDTRGAGIDPAHATAPFAAFEALAVLRINEVNPNIAAGRDLVELFVVSGGTTRDLLVQEDVGSSRATIATLPAVTVAAGDLIVLHLRPDPLLGDPDVGETVSKTESAAANSYPGAWDFVNTMSSTSSLTFSHRVLYVKTPAGDLQDAVAFVKSSTSSPPGGFPAALQSIQAAGQWLPADCGGGLCEYASSPSAGEVSVDWKDVGNDATTSLVRAGNADTNGKADWSFTAASSFGASNP